MPDRGETTRWGQRGRYLVPLAPRGPGRWFLHRLFAPHGGREVLGLRLARRLPAGLGARILLGAPEPGVESSLERFAAALAAVPELATFQEPEVRWILILDEPGSDRRRLVGFRFAPAAPEPDLVLKLQPSPAPALAREARGLRRLREELPADLATTWPRVLHHHEGEGFDLLALSVLPGTSGYVTARSRGLRRAARQLRVAARWLASFQEAGRRADDGTSHLPPWRELAPASDADAEPPPWYRDLHELTSHHPLPTVAGHGDFWPRNLLLPDGADEPPGVVDWEAWSEEASPVADLFHFPFALGQVVRWRSWGSTAPLDAFRKTFAERNPLSREVVQYVHAVVSSWGLPTRAAGPLLRLYLLSGARRKTSVPAAFAESPEACLAAYRLVESTPCVFSG